jgi:hypothetical protein
MARPDWPSDVPSRAGAPYAYTLYLDESGDHGIMKLHLDYPVLARCGIAVAQTYDAQRLGPAVDEFKVEHFGTASIGLHYRALAQKAGPFRFLQDGARAWAFEQAMGRFVAGLDVGVFGAVVNKREYVAQHGRTRPVDAYLPHNLYHMALDFVLERFLKFLEERGATPGRVVAESRGAKEDAELTAEYEELQVRGTQFVAAERFRRMLVPEMEFADKKAGLAGLELADLCAAPMATQVLKWGTASPVWDAMVPKIWVGAYPKRGSVGLKVYPRTSLLDGFYDDLVKRKSPGSP